MSKTFMTLTKAECLEVSNDCLANAEVKYKNALILASSDSYGDAVSLLIVSLEEMMKATILRLDSYGFQFRSKVDGIQSIFINHKLRYYLAFVLSVFNMLTEDFKQLIITLRSDPSKAYWMLDVKSPGFEKRLMKWFTGKIQLVNKEIVWFQNADMFRQEGFYVDFNNEIKSPLKIKEKDFDELKFRVENFKKFLPEFLESLDPEKQPSEVFQQHVSNLKKMFVKNGVYEKLGKLVSNLNSRNIDLFHFMRNSLEDIDKDALE